MAGKKARWRAAFLRALGRCGNVKLSAREAGVDPSTANRARRMDARFAGKWREALERAKMAPSPRSLRESPSKLQPFPPDKAKSSFDPSEGRGLELVLRVSRRHGAQLVKVAPGRWSARVEALFLAGLRRTGCVAAAAHGCGLSTTALYNRRKKDEDFRRRWREAAQEADERLPELLSAAAIAALDPEIDPADLPPCSIRDAIQICRMKGLGTPAAREQERRRAGPPVATNAEVRAALEKRLKAFSARLQAEKGEGGGPADQ